MDAYGVHVIKKPVIEEAKPTSPSVAKVGRKVGRKERSPEVTHPSQGKKAYSRTELSKVLTKPLPQFSDPFAENFVTIDAPEPEVHLSHITKGTTMNKEGHCLRTS